MKLELPENTIAILFLVPAVIGLLVFTTTLSLIRLS